jgi:hypothetical protein
MQTLLKHFNSLSDKDRFVRLNKNVEKGLEKELQESDFKDMHPIGSGVFAEVQCDPPIVDHLGTAQAH